MSVLVFVAYEIINKPAPTEQPLFSDNVLAQLRADQAKLKNKPTYTMLSGSYMGLAPFLIEQTVPVNPANCALICNGDSNCGGFQIHPDGTTCDILASSNISGYPFENSGWTYYQLSPKYTPTKMLSKLENQSPGGPTLGNSVSTSLEMCSSKCQGDSSCTNFSYNSAGICSLWNSNANGYVPPLAAPGTNTYTVINANTTQAFTSVS